MLAHLLCHRLDLAVEFNRGSDPALPWEVCDSICDHKGKE